MQGYHSGMRLVILHLSDIHLKSSSDRICARTEQIAAILDPAVHPADQWALVTTGDITNTAAENEYQAARGFFASISTEISKRRLAAPAFVLSVPGNHDCNLGPPQETRDVILEVLSRDESQSNVPDLRRTCTKPQDQYRAFHTILTALPWPHDEPIFFRKTLEVGGAQILLDCYNSAWTSRIDERAGSLIWPENVLPEPAKADLAISLLHHPINWFSQRSSRLLHHSLAANSDFVLTGHEHDSDYSKTSLADEEDLTHVEGAVLQDHKFPASCGFNVIEVDTLGRTYAVFQYDWKSALFRPRDRNPKRRSFRDEASRRDPRFRISTAFSSFLSDAGASFSHPRRDTVVLEDIYVPARLLEYTPLSRKGVTRVSLNSRKLVEILESQPRVLIVGSELSGKTSLVKTLFHDLRGGGLAPALLRGSDLRQYIQNISLNALVEAAITKEYSPDVVDEFLGLGREKRALVVDDLQVLALSAADLSRFCTEAATIFGTIVLLGNETIRYDEIAMLKDDAHPLLQYKQYDILPFGYEQREQLIDRWSRLGRADAVDYRAHDRYVTRTRTTVDAVVGKNRIPRKPLFVLIILQQLEAATPMESGGASYGYLFEALITGDLLRYQKHASPDTKYQFLSELAFRAFSAQRSFVSQAEYREFHKSYCATCSIDIDCAGLLSELVESRILRVDGDRVAFRYVYEFRYFVARYLDHAVGTRDPWIDKLIAALHRDDYAQILLFLAHLGRENGVPERVLAAAGAMYRDNVPCDLCEHVAFLSGALSTDATLKLPSGDAQANRLEMLRRLDEVDQGDGPDVEAVAALPGDAPSAEEIRSQVEIIVGINQAVKSVQLLGQMLKSRAGSLAGDKKLEIAKECYGVGLRCMSAVMGLMRDNYDDLAGAIAQFLVKRKNKRPDKAKRQAEEFVFAIGELTALSFVTVISDAVGLEILYQTLDSVREELDFDSVAVIDARIRMEHFGVFPEQLVTELADRLRRNPFGLWMLRLVVCEHFYLHEEDYRLRQRVCKQLGIDVGEDRGRLE
jgi:predicted phosphodiesterase